MWWCCIGRRRGAGSRGGGLLHLGTELGVLLLAFGGHECDEALQQRQSLLGREEDANALDQLLDLHVLLLVVAQQCLKVLVLIGRQQLLHLQKRRVGWSWCVSTRGSSQVHVPV